MSGDWLLTGSGTFTDANNWSSDPNIPSDGTASFNGAVGGTISSSGSISLAGLLFNSSSRAFLSGGQFTLTSGTIDSEHVNLDSLTAATPASLAPQIASVLSGSAGLTKIGAGALFLSGNNDFTGDVIVNAGTLQISTDPALGNVNNNLILNAAALQSIASSPFTINRSITLGTGTSSLAGPMTLGNAIGGSGNLRLVGDAQILTAINGYSGATAISGGGTAGVTLSGAGALANSLNILVSNSQLLLSNAAQAVSDRIADKASLTLHTGTFGLDGNATTALREVADTLTLDGGGNAIRITNVNTTAAGLGINKLTRNNHATLAIQAPTLNRVSSPGTSFTIGNLSSLLVGGAVGSGYVGVLPFAVEDSTFSSQQLLTASSATLRPLTSAEYQTNVGSWNLYANGKLTADTTLGGVTSVNALLNNANTLSGSSVLSVTSGLIAGAGTVTCPVDFGTHEGVILSTHVTSPISGSGGVTYDLLGGGLPIVTLNNSNTYSGQTTLNGGTYIINASVTPNTAGPFGSDSSAIVLFGGGSPGTIDSTSAITFSRDLVVDSSPDMKIANAPSILGSFTISGTVTLNGPLRLSNAMNLTGKITGLGSIVDNFGQSNVTLSGANDYTGGTILKSGALNLGSNTALGTGTLTLNGTDSLVSRTGARTLSNAVFFDPAAGLAPDTLTFAVGSSFTLSGPVDLGTQAVHISTLNSFDTLSGAMSNGSLVKDGAGTLRVGQLNLASLNITAGTLQLGNSAPASRTAGLALSNGSRLDIGASSLVVTYPAGSSPADTIRGYIQSSALFSSSSATNVTGIGYADNASLNASTFGSASGSVAVAGRSVLIKNTYFGDANLDGKVDVVDLGLIASHWQLSGVWLDGDFNYDGKVDVVDLGQLASNWQAGVTGPSTMSFAQAMAFVGLGGSAVPEPATASTLLFAATLAAARRKRSA